MMLDYKNYWDAFTVPLTNTLQRVVAFLPRMLVAIILFMIFYGLAALSRHVSRKSLERFGHIPWAIRILVARMVYLGVLLIGVLVALSAANINVATVLTSLGVAGFALGFALKDILENFISGILLLFARPFEVGDQVMLSSFEGTVRDIQIRTTTLETYSNETVVIPNSDVYTHPVVNHTRLGRRRYHADFDTSLSVDTERIEKEILEIAHDNPEVAAEPPPQIRIIGVESANDVIHWRLSFGAEPTKAVEVRTISQILTAVKRRLYDAGVPTPTTISTTVLKRGSAVADDGPHTPAGPVHSQNGRPAPA